MLRAEISKTVAQCLPSGQTSAPRFVTCYEAREILDQILVICSSCASPPVDGEVTQAAFRFCTNEGDRLLGKWDNISLISEPEYDVSYDDMSIDASDESMSYDGW